MGLSLPRRVEREILDDLPVEDSRAQRARRDLRRIHRAMATLPIIQRALDRGTSDIAPRTLLELGAGDGSLMLRVARRRAKCWPDMSVMLLDRLNLVTPETLEGLREAGWTPRVLVTDVFDWLAKRADTRWDIVLANLFVHHFTAGELKRLLVEIAGRTDMFLCCEPRRSALALAGSHLLGVLGVSTVTKHDAVSSVHAGFRARELSTLWPDQHEWAISEYPAGLFSHCFLAVRKAR